MTFPSAGGMRKIQKKRVFSCYMYYSKDFCLIIIEMVCYFDVYITLIALICMDTCYYQNFQT